MRPLAFDLCCGSGGWAAGLIAEGWRVIGFDIEPQPQYPGEFHRIDVRDCSLLHWPQAPDFIVASPPCEQFSRHQMPWTKRRNPPEPDLSIVGACWDIANAYAVPMVLENVRMAQKWLGRAKWHCGPFYLWGEVPAIMPAVQVHRKERMSSTARLERARVPIELARYIGRVALAAGDCEAAA